MFERIVKAVQGKADKEEVQALCARLVQENDALRLENARLRMENRYLRRRLADRELRRLRRAEQDALLIGALLFGHQSTSRTACLDYGISRRRWAWAMGLLQIAQVRTTDGRWHYVQLNEFEGALRGAVRIVEQKGMQHLADRLPRNGYSGMHKTRPRTPSSSHAQGHAQRARRDW